MEIMTEVMGQVSYSEADIISFPDGLYGFEDQKSFILLNIAEVDFPFQWLQSLTDASLSFIVTTPFAFCEAYDFEIPESVVGTLGLEKIEDLAIHTLVVLKEELKESSINLKAPIIINLQNNQGRQIILNEDYPYKYFLFDKKED